MSFEPKFGKVLWRPSEILKISPIDLMIEVFHIFLVSQELFLGTFNVSQVLY